MKKGKDFSRLFSKGQQLETSLSTSSIFSHDSGLHLTSYKVSAAGKSTVIDNLSVFGSTILVLESKNFTLLQGDSLSAFWRGRGVSRYFSIPSPIKQNEYHVKILKQYLFSKGLRLADFKIEHYIIVPDKCKVEVDERASKSIMAQTELETYKRKLGFYNTEVSSVLGGIIKEGLF